MVRSHQDILAVCSLLAVALYPLAPVRAQDLFVTSNRTIGGGNPVNGNYNQVAIGFDAARTPFPGVHADITGGSIISLLASFQNVVTISGGSIGIDPGPGASVIMSAIVAGSGSTFTITGGTINSFLSFGNRGSSNHDLNALVITGGTLPYLEVYDDSQVTITGGVAQANGAFTRGALINQGNGTFDVTGGTSDFIGQFGSGTFNFGGVATTDTFNFGGFGGGTANITGGAISHLNGSGFATSIVSGGTIGGVSVGGNSFLTLNGSGLTVTEGATHGVFDPDNFINTLTTDYTVTGTLSDGAAFNAMFTAGAGYTGDASSLTFQGSGNTPAPDLFVTEDSGVTGIYNYVTIGTDETFSEIASPTVTYNAESALLDTENGANVTMTGGIVYAGAFVNGESSLTVAGGRGDSKRPLDERQGHGDPDRWTGGLCVCGWEQRHYSARRFALR
jgi:hypothetical protein